MKLTRLHGHSRSSRDEAARFRVCQGKKFNFFWQLGSISCRCKEILSLKLHPSVGPVTLIILRLCHPQKKRKTNWQPPSRESLRKSYCSFSATSMPALVLIKAHSPFFGSVLHSKDERKRPTPARVLLSLQPLCQ